MIRLTNVSYAYPTGVAALNDISVGFPPGRVTAIIGPNGSGKSTIAKLAAGLLQPDSGSIDVDGLTGRGGDPWTVRRSVSLAWQNPDNQIVCGIVEDDLAFGPENLGLEPAEIEHRIARIVELLGLAALREASVHRLTSARRQLLAVAGAMALEPRYLILDEVTSRLDAATSNNLLDAVLGWAREREAGVIMISHQMGEVLRAHQVIRLERDSNGAGRIAHVASPDEVLRDAAEVVELRVETPLRDVIQRLKQLGVEVPGQPVTAEDLVMLLCP